MPDVPISARAEPRRRATLDRRVRRGELVRLLPGVYAPPAVSTTLTCRVAAVALWDVNAVIFGSAAARLTYAREQRVTVVDVAARSELRRPGYRFSRRSIPSELVIERWGVRLTTPALTALDLAAEVGGDAIDDVLRARAARLADLWAALRACPHRAGNRERLRLLLDSRDAPWSAAERWAHRLLRRRGISGWVANYAVLVAGAHYFIDIAFPGIRLAIEIDGRYHDRLEAFEYDRRRQNDLVTAGWTVLRITWLMLTEDPDGVLDLVAATAARLRRRLPAVC